MSALYKIRYLGSTGVGFGVLYIGRGKIIGIDVTNTRYTGSYVDEGGRMKGNLTLAPLVDAVLVTGKQVSPGTTIPITIDFPSNFADGRPQKVSVGGLPVAVTFEKIGDVP
jgi:hypothetical protein